MSTIDLSLHRIEALLTRFTPYTRPTVHIAGTNGKGSVSALLTSLFQRAGLSVGRFNSPHLLHPSDCIYLKGAPVSTSIYTDVMKEVREVNEAHEINASSFEVLTVCALLIFERTNVDVVLLEVGMGGRLDATNVVPDACILASVITAIDLDHQAFLGPTVESIAREKAGIIRRRKPVVLATQSHESVQGVVSEVSNGLMAPLVLAPEASEREWDEEIDGERPPPFSLRPFAPPPLRPIHVDLPSLVPANPTKQTTISGTSLKWETSCRVLLPLHGPHQLGNLGVALTVLHVLRNHAIFDRTTASPSTSSDSSVQAKSNSLTVYERLEQMDERAIHAAVAACVWPGRLSFHLYRNISPSPSVASEGTSECDPLVVLVDGAHNEAAARTLSQYTTSLLASLDASQQTREGKRPKRRVYLTLILALSHSPPKTPASILVPLLAPFIRRDKDTSSPRSSEQHSLDSLYEHVDIKTRVALVRFTPPEGMPWVRSVPPSVTHEIIGTSFPGTEEIESWVAPILDEGQSGDALDELNAALRWAAEGTSAERKLLRDEEGEQESFMNLVLIAGSLYLVADFYRLLLLQR